MPVGPTTQALQIIARMHELEDTHRVPELGSLLGRDALLWKPLLADRAFRACKLGHHGRQVLLQVEQFLRGTLLHHLPALLRFDILLEALVPETFLHLHFNVGETTNFAEALNIAEHKRGWEDAIHLAAEQPHRLTQVHQRSACYEERVHGPGQVGRSRHVADRAQPAAEATRRAQETQHGLGTTLRHAHEEHALALLMQQRCLVVHELTDQLVSVVHGCVIQDVHPSNAATEGTHIGVLMPRAISGKDHDHADRAHAARQCE
mmetsp:Transcript_36651/g.101817  ORF Transcript_36651/g.101817 Transcript_36651/m.101817 type:complete len:263 (+) Transcript_36651:76-864(+)